MKNLLYYDIFNIPIDNLFQWDANLQIKIKGAEITSPLPVFHVSKSIHGNTPDIVPKLLNREYYITVPSDLLTTPGMLHIYMCTEGNDASHLQTIGRACIPVFPRIKATPYPTAVVGQAIVGESVVYDSFDYGQGVVDQGLVGQVVVA